MDRKDKILRLFACEHMADEVDAALDSAGLSGVEVNRFDPACESPVSAWSDLPAAFSSHVPRAPRVVMGGRCLACLRQTPEFERPGQLLDSQECFHYLTGRRLADELTASGAFLVSPGWLRSWRRHLEAMKLEGDATREFFRASANRIVLVDTANRPETIEELEAFGAAAGLPAERIRVGLDHLELVLSNLVQQQTAARERHDHKEALSHSQRQIAKYAMSIELLSDMANMRGESEVIAKTFDLLTMLFAPRSLCYAPIQNGVCQEPYAVGAPDAFRSSSLARFAESRAPYAWENDREAFLVRINDGQDTLGVLGVGKVTFPQFQDNYLNQTLSMVGILSLAIRNARQRENVAHEEAQREAFGQRIQQSQRLESLSQMAGGVAHHLNNILQSMVGFCELTLGELEPEATARKWVEEIQNLTMRAATLGREMLACSGQSALESQETDIEELIENMLPLLEGLQPDGVRVVQEAPVSLPTLQGDGAQLRQVFSNIMTNACEAMESRKGTIRIQLSESRLSEEDIAATWPRSALKPGRYVRLDVADEGEGMDEATRERVFDPFFSTRMVGRGLGMAAARGIACSHGGEIRIESRPDRGTKVSLFLPATGAPVRKRQASEALDARRVESTRESGTVLLVDDEESVRQLATKMLSRIGFDVLPARDGVEALEALEKCASRVRCVVLDVLMPRMGGEECLSAIRKRWPGMPVVVSTGHHAPESMNRLHALGISGLVRKPYRTELLRASIRQAIGNTTD